MSFYVGPAFFQTPSEGVVYPYLVYDTFTGTGSLSTHLGEVGTPWTSAGAATYTLSDGFACPTTGIGDPTFATGSDTFDNGYVDIEFTHNAPFFTGTTVLLLNGNLVGAPTNIVDSSLYQRTIVPTGSAAISTTQFKYGGGSILANGTGNYISSAFVDDGFDFGTADWTIETWRYLLDYGTFNGDRYSHYFCINNQTTFALKSFYDPDTSSSYTYLVANGSTQVTDVTPIVLNTWEHIAIVRYGTLLMMYVNGIRKNVATISALTSFGAASGTIYCGTAPGTPGENLQGHIDDLRVTKGYARYRGPFFTTPGSQLVA